MSMAPQATSPAPQTRSKLVVMGRQDFFSILLRLIGMELYKIWRGVMSKVLGILALLAAILPFLVILLIFLVSISNNGGFANENSQAVTDPLLPPIALFIIVQVLRNVGPVLIIILIGTMAGREYNMGTIRLMYTRGPSRTLFFLSKVGAAIFCVVVGVLGMILLALLSGLFFNLFVGVSPNFSFIDGGWLNHVTLYVLETLLNMFIYAMMALFIATLGRSTAAGIAGGLAWALLESVVVNILQIIGRLFANNAIGSFLANLADYSISKNLTALFNIQEQYIVAPTNSSGAVITTDGLSEAHALIVLGVYLILFIGIAWWVNERRDVTN